MSDTNINITYNIIKKDVDVFGSNNNDINSNKNSISNKSLLYTNNLTSLCDTEFNK